MAAVSNDMDRWLARVDVADLLRLAALAADAEAGLFERRPHGSGRYAGRLLGRALCQGAAVHYVNGKNGVKDFDVWSFYAQHEDWPFPARWRGTRDFGPSKFGRHPAIRRSTAVGAWTFSGARFRSSPAPTRPMPSTIIWPLGTPPRPGHLQLRQWS